MGMGRYGYGYSSREEAVEVLCRVLTSDREFNRMNRLVMERTREFSYEKFRDRVKDIISGVS